MNCLKLNANKTKASIFGSSVKINSDECKYANNIVVNDCVIQYERVVKYLGVLIDDTLSWENQVVSICSRAMTVLAQLKINNEIFNKQLKIKLVTTLIFPIFDYCCVAYTNISKKLQIRMQRKMNSCVKYIFKISRLEHVTPYYARLGWLKVDVRRDYFIACLFYKEIMLNYQQLFRYQLEFLPVALRRGDIRNDFLRLPRSNCCMYKHSFLVHGIRVWNSLPAEITKINNFEEFRNACFNYYTESRNYQDIKPIILY